jgi:hypothetical protein
MSKPKPMQPQQYHQQHVETLSTGGMTMSQHRIYRMKFSSVYPLYVKKAERKNRTQDEVDQIICWLTGYNLTELQNQIALQSDFETFFARAAMFNPKASLIKGVVCGVRVEEIEDPLMRKVRYLDKLIDELAKGKTLAKILRQ